MWIQKKPLSKVQLYQKLLAYGFSKQDINGAIREVEQLFNDKELLFIGGLTKLAIIQTVDKNTPHKIAKYTINNPQSSDTATLLTQRQHNFEMPDNANDSYYFTTPTSSISTLRNKDDPVHSLNLWDMLALSCCIMMIQQDNSISYKTILGRLQLRAYSCSLALTKIIQKIL